MVGTREDTPRHERGPTALPPNKGSARNPFGGQFKGYAFAYFDSVENATLAKDQLTGTLVEGASLNVKFCGRVWAWLGIHRCCPSSFPKQSQS